MCKAIISSEALCRINPNPVISWGVPAYSAEGCVSDANNGDYKTFWKSSSPDHIAYDLSCVPSENREKVIAVWYNESTYDNIGSYVSQSDIPTDYTIDVNPAAGGKYPENGWETAENVTGNPFSSRQHIISMKGFNWIRMNITRSNGRKNGRVKLNLDIHDVSGGVSDSWLFLGDSVTGCGMNNCYGTGFASHIHNLDSRFFPIQENGGIGGLTSSDGREHIDRWLSAYIGRFVSIAFGTNDAWGGKTNAKEYYSNTKYMIEAVLSAGKIPVLPKIPFSSEKAPAMHIPSFNAEIERLWSEYSGMIVQGADLEALLGKHREYLSADGVHPNAEGYEAIRKFWAETMYKAVY